jgi:hypothetical protein
MGGLWEAAVKSTKGHLKRVIGNVILNYEELNTLLTMIEACLNSRPLTPVSNDPADVSALTPRLFLIGDALTSPAEPDLAEIPCNRLNRYQLLMKLRQHFWRRWSINSNKGRNGPPPSIISRKTRSWSSVKTTWRHSSGH